MFKYCIGLRSSAVVGERDPILLVSGIGGSILHSKRKKLGLQTRAWVRIMLADMEFKKRLWSLYNPKTGYTESMASDTEIVVPDDDFGLYAIDILDPSFLTKCIHLKEVYYFHEMIDMLVGCGYKKGTSLFGYGYDFRQSNRIHKVIDGLKIKLETAFKASGDRKVNIISHSMGGLLVMCFLSLHRAVFSRYVGKWICIGCPFQGAPGCINDSLLTGLQFVEGFENFFFVSRWTMHQLDRFPFREAIKRWRSSDIGKICGSVMEVVSGGDVGSYKFESIIWLEMLPGVSDCLICIGSGLSSAVHVFFLVECPSIYEMLPNPEFMWKEQPQILVWRKQSDASNENSVVRVESYNPLESVSLFEEALKHNELSYKGKTVALPFNFSIFSWAAETRQILNKAKLPEGVCFYNIFGKSFDTPFDVCYGMESSPIAELTEICHTMPRYSYVDGDGTVPSESAKADGFDARERVGICSSHRELLTNKTVFLLIQKWLGIQHVNHISKSSRVMDAYTN